MGEYFVSLATFGGFGDSGTEFELQQKSLHSLPMADSFLTMHDHCGKGLDMHSLMVPFSSSHNFPILGVGKLCTVTLSESAVAGEQ